MAGRPKLKGKVAIKKNIDTRSNNMHNETENHIGTAPDSILESPVTATAAVTATENIPKQKDKIESLLMPLTVSAEDELIQKRINDVSHLQPSRSNQVLTVFWKGKDIRKEEVQATCPFHFVWHLKDKKNNYSASLHEQNIAVVKKSEFIVNGVCMVSVSADQTPSEDFFSNGDLILTYYLHDIFIKDRIRRAVKNNRKISDTFKQNKESFQDSATRLSAGDVDGAMKVLTTKDLLNRVEQGDFDSAVQESLNDGFESSVIKI